MIARVVRLCDFEEYPHGTHVWERLNHDFRPFRRGRVVFLCRGLPSEHRAGSSPRLPLDDAQIARTHEEP